MAVPTRYILAACAFAIAALGLLLLPVDAAADCMGCNRPPPPCQQGCQPPAPPPPPSTNCCRPPTVVVPPPHVPPPNIVVVNAGAHASAQANSTAIAIANVQGGDTIIRQSTMVNSAAGAYAATQSSSLSVTDAAIETETYMRERELRIEAICLDANGNPHPASQTFGGRDVRERYRGEIFRCVAGTRMRYTMDGRSYDCQPGEALWYENGAVECRPQIARRQCNERSLLRRHGPGDKVVRIRETATREIRRETAFNGSMTMDGGVGAGVY